MRKITVERRKISRAEWPIGSGNLFSLSTSIFWQIPLTSMVYFYTITQSFTLYAIIWFEVYFHLNHIILYKIELYVYALFTI